jgi:NAD(P)-dependent dehydrogenase (short-subunit alcohol dehydrogenase family)
MSSNTANRFTVPNHSLYSASKAAIECFVRVLANDCGKKKITINAIAPGGTVTDMFYAVAKHYIPNSDNFSDAQLKDVSFSTECRDFQLTHVSRWRLMPPHSIAMVIPSIWPTLSCSWQAKRGSGSMARS